MTTSERAAQLWSVLALASRNRQVLTYNPVAKLTGIARVGLGQCLEPVQSYCLLRELPPLTILARWPPCSRPARQRLADPVRRLLRRVPRAVRVLSRAGCAGRRAAE